MRKISSYIAVSLNGEIAKKDGSVDWLESIPNPDKFDYGYNEFYDSIDTTIQGHSTYSQLISWGVDFPYAKKKNYVFTRKTNLSDTQYVDFISGDHLQFIQELREQQSGQGIWIVGGGQLNSFFLNNNLLDEIILFVMPVILSDGIDLFATILNETELRLLESKSYSNGVVALRYGLK